MGFGANRTMSSQGFLCNRFWDVRVLVAPITCHRDSLGSDKSAIRTSRKVLQVRCRAPKLRGDRSGVLGVWYPIVGVIVKNAICDRNMSRVSFYTAQDGINWINFETVACKGRRLLRASSHRNMPWPFQLCVSPGILRTQASHNMFFAMPLLLV
jgi:hypothetical protein